MGLFDFLQRPKIDPALEEQLKKRGMADKLRELQNNRPVSSTRQFFRELIPSTAKVGSKVLDFTGGKKLAQGLAGSIAAPQVNRIEQQNLKAKTDLLQGIRDEARRGELNAERRRRLLKMAEQIGVGDVAKEIPELQLTNKEILADAGQLALTAALGFKPGLNQLNTSGKLASNATVKTMKGLRAFNKTVQAEERIRKYGSTAGKLLNYGINTAKQIAVDAPIGAGLFGLQAYGEGKSNADVAKQAAVGAGVMAATPIALGAAIRTVVGASGLLNRKVIGPAGDALISKLEKVAAGSAPKVTATDEVAKTLAVYPKRFAGMKQAAAEKTLGFIKAAQDLPAKFTDRFAVIAKKFGYENYRDARLASATAEGKAEMALGDMFGTKSKPGSLTPYADIEDAVKARITKLDFLARAQAGQKTASRETVPQLEAGLQKLTQEAGSNEPRVQEALKVWNNFHLKMLNERVDAGLISAAARDAMLKKYPNYMPHKVIMDLDEEIANQYIQGSSLNVAKTDIQKAVGSERQLEDPFAAVAGRLPNTYGVIEKNKAISGMVQAQEASGGKLVPGMRIATVKEPAKLGEQTINFFRNGIKETWVVPDDVAVAIKNLDAEKMSTVMRALTAPTRLLKAFATRYNLSFLLPNKLRDKQTALLTADAFIEDMLAKTGGTFPGSGPVNLSKDELYRVWKEAGGGFGSVFREARPPQNMRNLGTLKKQGIWNNIGEMRPDKAIDHLNQTIEESTRLAVFEKALNRGLSIKDAALVSRDATIDFSKMGTWMRSLNEIIPFLNPRVQGVINLGRAAKFSPETFARMQMWSAVYPTLALHQWNSQFASSKNIPQYFYDNYWVIQTGEAEGFDNNGKPITIPKFITLRKGEGQALVSNPMQYFLRRADGSDPRRVGQMIRNTIGSLSPVAIGDGSPQKNIFLSFISQFGPLANIGIGLGTNIDPYSGQQIIPESRKDASKAMQFKTTTPQIIREAAGVMGVSPANLDFVLNSLGGVPGDVVSALNLGQGALKGEGLRTNPLEESKFGQATRLPVTKRFFRESTGYGSATDIKNRELKTELQAEVTDKSLKIKDEAQKYLQEMNKFKTKEERVKYLEQVNPSEEVRKKMSQLKKTHQAVEVLTTQDSVELRAKYIWQRIAEMKQANVSIQDRTKFLDDLEQAKILTDDVRKVITQLKQQ